MFSRVFTCALQALVHVGSGASSTPRPGTLAAMRTAGMLRRRMRGGFTVDSTMAERAHMVSADEVCKQCGVDKSCGLSEEEVVERQATFGLNVLPSKVCLTPHLSHISCHPCAGPPMFGRALSLSLSLSLSLLSPAAGSPSSPLSPVFPMHASAPLYARSTLTLS
jgi:hypothetical protein